MSYTAVKICLIGIIAFSHHTQKNTATLFISVILIDNSLFLFFFFFLFSIATQTMLEKFAIFNHFRNIDAIF